MNFAYGPWLSESWDQTSPLRHRFAKILAQRLRNKPKIKANYQTVECGRTAERALPQQFQKRSDGLPLLCCPRDANRSKKEGNRSICEQLAILSSPIVEILPIRFPAHCLLAIHI